MEFPRANCSNSSIGSASFSHFPSMARHIPCQGIEEEGRERVRELKATKVGGGGGGGRERVAREEGGGKKGGVAYYRYTRRARATLTTLTADGGIASPFGVVS